MNFEVKKTVVLALVGLCITSTAHATLKHRYSFSADANDVVGGLASILVADAVVSDGSLILDGVDDCLEMDAAGIAINTYTTGLTLELWSTQGPENQTFSMTASLGDTWGNGFGKDFIAISTTRGNELSRGMIAITPDQDAPWADEVGVDGPELNDAIEHHYVLTIDDPAADGSGELAYYIDGELMGTTPLNGALISDVSNQYAYLGKGTYSVDGQVRCRINEFRIHDTALTTQEVQGSYAAGPDALPGAFLLKHRYDFTTDANDIVGGLTSTLVADALVTDGSLVLDGVDDCLEMDATGIAINTYTTGLTLELWSTQGPENQTFSMTASLGDTWENGFGKDFVAISTTRGNELSRGMIAITPDQDAPWADEVGVDGPELNDALEHQYVLTIDDPAADGSGELAYYIDGELLGTTPLNGALIGDVSNMYAYLGKGTYAVDGQVRCRINEFRIYGAALTIQEVQANYLAGPDVIPVGVRPKSFPLDSLHITATASTSHDPNSTGAANTINGSGLVQGQHSTLESDMWLSDLDDADPSIQFEFDEVYKLDKMRVWNYNTSMEPQFGIGIQDVNIIYSTDGDNWEVLEHVTLEQATGTDDYAGTEVPLDIAAKVVILDINSNWSPFMLPQYGLSEVSFYAVPVLPTELSPANGTLELPGEVLLSWTPGREAVTHEIYMGTEPDALELIASVEESSYLALVDLDSTYYWQVVEVNEAATPSSWASDLMKFSTLASPRDPGNDGVAAIYHFEGDLTDSSGNGLGGTLFGEPNFVDGLTGMALDFDGVDDYATLPIGGVIASADSITVALWANFSNEGGAWQRLFDFGSGSGANPYMFISPRVGGDGPVRLAIRSATVGEVIVESPATLPSDWHHVAVTIDAFSRNMVLYLDGEIVDSVLTSVLPSDMGETTQNYLGKSQWPDALYQGALDELYIYTRALGVGEIGYLAGKE